jgi:hypothetical protein
VDCESDGHYEILIGSDDDRLFVLGGDGTNHLGGPSFSSDFAPAGVADLVDGPRPES